MATDMRKRATALAVGAALVTLPAVLGLVGNDSLTRVVSIPAPARAEAASRPPGIPRSDDHSTDATRSPDAGRSRTTGPSDRYDRNGTRRSRHAERGDDRKADRSINIEAGDDHRRHRSGGVETGDDRAADRSRQVEARGDHDDQQLLTPRPDDHGGGRIGGDDHPGAHSGGGESDDD